MSALKVALCVPWLCRLVWEEGTPGLPHTCPAPPRRPPGLEGSDCPCLLGDVLFLQHRELLLPSKQLDRDWGRGRIPPTLLKEHLFPLSTFVQACPT